MEVKVFKRPGIELDYGIELCVKIHLRAWVNNNDKGSQLFSPRMLEMFPLLRHFLHHQHLLCLMVF